MKPLFCVCRRQVQTQYSLVGLIFKGTLQWTLVGGPSRRIHMSSSWEIAMCQSLLANLSWLSVRRHQGTCLLLLFKSLIPCSFLDFSPAGGLVSSSALHHTVWSLVPNTFFNIGCRFFSFQYGDRAWFSVMKPLWS